MANITCTHPTTKALSTHGFDRGVSVDPYTESNPSAHGNITVHVECTACGARRLENINGRHVEVSPWRGSSKERESAVIHARAEVVRTRPAPVKVTRGSDGAEATVSVNAEGLLVIDAPSFAAQKAIMGALPDHFVASYEVHRAAIDALRAAEAEAAK